MSPFAVFLIFCMSYTRMSISEKGIDVRGTLGFKPLFVPWENIERIRAKHGSEALILKESLQTKSAKSMANWSGIYIRGVPYYDDEQRGFINQLRYVPIDAFGWWFEHGNLKTKIQEFAPSLIESFEEERKISAVASEKDKKIIKIVFGITALLLAAAIYIGINEPEFMKNESFVAFDNILSIIFKSVLSIVLVLTGGLNFISSTRFLKEGKIFLSIFWMIAAIIQLLLIVAILST